MIRVVRTSTLDRLHARIDEEHAQRRNVERACSKLGGRIKRDRRAALEALRDLALVRARIEHDPRRGDELEVALRVHPMTLAVADLEHLAAILVEELLERGRAELRLERLATAWSVEEPRRVDS